MSVVGEVNPKYPWGGVDCGFPGYSASCFPRAPAAVSLRGSMRDSAWFCSSDPEDASYQFDSTELEELKAEVKAVVMNNWDPTPRQVIDLLNGGKLGKYDWNLVAHARNMILAEICLATESWHSFYKRLSCLCPSSAVVELIERDLDPDVKYYSDIADMVKPSVLREHIRQMDIELGQLNESYVGSIKTNILNNDDAKERGITGEYKSLEQRQQKLLQKLHKQAEITALIDHQLFRAQEVHVCEQTAFHRTISTALRTRKIEEQGRKVLGDFGKRALEIGCVISDVLENTRDLLALLTGEQETPAERKIALEKREVEEATTKECGICSPLPVPHRTTPMKLRSPFGEDEEAFCEENDEEVEEEAGKYKFGSRLRCPRQRGGGCDDENFIRRQIAKLRAVPDEKPIERCEPVTEYSKAACFEDLFWSVTAAILSPFRYFLFHDHCSDEMPEEDTHKPLPKDDCGLLKQCTIHLGRGESETKEKKAMDLVIGKDTPVLVCFRNIFQMTFGPIFDYITEKFESFVDLSVEETQESSQDPCKKPCPQHLKGLHACPETKKFVNKSSNCSIMRFAEIVQKSLVNFAEINETCTTGATHPLVQELLRTGSPAGDHPPKTLARMIKRQVQEFKESLEFVIDFGEGLVHSTVDDKLIEEEFTQDERLERKARNLFLLREYR